MPCSPSQVLNPESKRCVRRDGRIGKRVLASGCRQDQIRNPSTNRCVLRSGRRSEPEEPPPLGPQGVQRPRRGADVLPPRSCGRRSKRLDPPYAARLTRPTCAAHAAEKRVPGHFANTPVPDLRLKQDVLKRSVSATPIRRTTTRRRSSATSLPAFRKTVRDKVHV